MKEKFLGKLKTFNDGCFAVLKGCGFFVLALCAAAALDFMLLLFFAVWGMDLTGFLFCKPAVLVWSRALVTALIVAGVCFTMGALSYIVIEVL